METDGTMKKKLGNEQSEDKFKKRKKQKRAKTEKEEVKKTTEEEGQKKKTMEEEGELNKTTDGEGKAEKMKVDQTLEKNPENDQSKSNKMNGANIEKEGQVKKNRQEEIPTEKEQKTDVIETLVNSLTKDELQEVLKSSTQNVPGLVLDIFNRIDLVASRDELKRTLYVNNLNQETSSEMLRKAFLQYGKIEKAKVIEDKDSGKSIGFGIVQFCTKSSALSALRDPKKEINGRQIHCSLQKDQCKSSSTQNNPQRISSIESYMEVHGPGESVNPAMHGPGGFVNPTSLGRGEYVNQTVFGPRVNPTFPCHLNSQAVLGDFQFPNQWGHSNLQYETITPYMSLLVKSLEDAGYIDGKSLLGAPYDFRYGPGTKPSSVGRKYLHDLQKLVEEAYSSNGDKQVILVSHSLGGLWALYLLNQQPFSWRQQYIKHFVAIAAPWGGTVQEMRTFASGYSLDIPTVNPLVVRAEQRSSESNLWLLPVPEVFGNKTLVQTEQKSYSAFDMPEFLNDIGFSEGIYPYKSRIRPLTEHLKAPKVPVTLIFGTGIDTPEALIYGKGGFDQQPDIILGDGDGTVNLCSLSAVVSNWSATGGQKLMVVQIPQCTHTSILKDEDSIKKIVDVILDVNLQSAHSTVT